MLILMEFVHYLQIWHHIVSIDVQNSSLASSMILILSRRTSRVKCLACQLTKFLSAGDNSVIKFWTTGMYNPEEETWFWYAGTSNQVTTFPASVTTKRIAYSHWRNFTAPTPRTINDVCLTVAIDRQRNIDYWTNEFCYRQLATICEIPKRCL